MEGERVQLVFLACPVIGHLISMVELAKHMVKQRPFSANFLLMRSLSAGIDTYIQAVSPSSPHIHFIHLPPVDMSSDNVTPAFISVYVQAHKTLIKDAVTNLSSPSAFIMDVFASTMIDVAAELNIPAYLFFTSTAVQLGLMLYLPTLDEKIPEEFEEFQGEIELPGISPFPPVLMPTPLLNKKAENYTWFLYYSRRLKEAQGIILNTFAEFEPTSLQAIRAGECLPDHDTPAIYPIGPLIAFDEENTSNPSELFEWLDEQPHESVVFLCFGSMGAFPPEQVKEMALGLEKSGHRFLWSLRYRSSDNFSLPEDANLKEVLPDGFLDRTKGKGLVCPSWVPQAAVLAHPAIGGFVSHCGWNSFLESLWYGVPILTWPIYAEQKLNAFEFVRDLGIALELRLDYRAERPVLAEELERGVRCLMGENEEGVKLRTKVKEMGKQSRKAMEEGGSSLSFLNQLADKLVQGKHCLAE